MTEYTHLQGIGKFPAKRGNQLQIGDVIVYNYGYTSTVMDIAYSKSGKTMKLTTRSNDTNNVFIRRNGTDRLFAIKEDVTNVK